jgi:K+-transporting ATPase ATPase A chain
VLTNLYSILGMMLVTSAFIFFFATWVGRRRQGWLLYGAVSLLFVAFLATVVVAEQTGNPLLTAAGADQALTAGQSGGNMEGKEVRFGQAQTGLFVTATTAATTGTVDAMHDSLTPLGGFVPLSEIMLNSVFGGKGVGFMNIIQNAILAVFIVGLMVGRTPEFLGKKIEAREVKLVMLSVLAHPASILGFTALAVVVPVAVAAAGNPGAHGFSEILYAYASGTANNGSAFAGLSGNIPFYNITIGFAILIGRYLSPIIPLLAVGGALAAKKTVPETAGTFNTATPLFGGLLVGVILIVGGLTFFPALALGPLVEHLQMVAGVIVKP